MTDMPDCPDYGRYSRSMTEDGTDRCDHCGRTVPLVASDGGGLVVGTHKPRCSSCDRERDLWFVEFRAAGGWHRMVVCREHLLSDDEWLLQQRGSVDKLDPDAPPLSATRPPSVRA